ncbi:uncharacterized protein LOC134443711 [Engraulis encrasicolus]|uniref:uncharacterized protein LOC134443711 n=1 Tax=Engraulis encrasicolus TaxID=184585 RepID=UPI002FD5EFD4
MIETVCSHNMDLTTKALTTHIFFYIFVRIGPTFDLSYKLFCERVIRQRLLINQEVLRMSQLRKAFIALVQSSEGVDASTYRQDMLKKRLSRDFPQLVFHTAAKRNTSELVFAENLSTNAVLDLLPSGAETTQSSEMSQTDSDTERRKSKQPTTAEETQTLYTAALLLKRLLSHSPGMACPWPPTAVNFNLTEVICCGMRKRCVPGCFHRSGE